MRNTLRASTSALAVVGAGALTFGLASPAAAAGGNILLTGHDNDFHCSFGPTVTCGVLGAETNFVRNGSALPVLVIDRNNGFGLELSSALTTEGIAHTTVAAGAVTAGMFDHTKYSAFAVASVTSCSGCDNLPGTGATLAGFETAITSFFNAGGGILGLTGASDPSAFSYVPEAGGTTTPIFTSSGFVATANGLADIPGFTAVNGDETHNTFAGFSPFYKVAERFGSDGPAVTIYGTNGHIGCTGTKCTISGGIPEPSTWALLGLGFFSLGVAVRKRKLLAA
jgi:hypothetical protein